MGQFYFHNGDELLEVGTCPDGQEALQRSTFPGAKRVIGPAPCNPRNLKPDEFWCMREGCVKKREVAPDVQWMQARFKRDQLLAASDWRVTRAQETGIALPPEWVQYRQALRDITQQSDPGNLVWPLEPMT